MKKKTLNVAFSTQKGGAGKTTMTVLVASYLHYLMGYNVAVIDCDYPQHSMMEMRKRDLNLALNDPYYKKLVYDQFTKIKKKAYPVIESSPENALSDAEKLCENMDIDIIFYDLPGTADNEFIIRTISHMDYIFSPISADRLVLQSTLQFIVTINDTLVVTQRSQIRAIRLIWNQVDGREKTELYGVYENVIDQLGFKVFKTFLPNSVRFRRELTEEHREIFRSTLFPVDKSLMRGSNLEELVQEILELLKDYE